MVGFVVATHGDLANGFKSALNLILGKIDNSEFLGLREGNNVDSFGKKIIDATTKLNDGSGVIIFTDLQGASPFNQASIKLRSTKKINYKILTGVNLPMLVQAINDRMMHKDITTISQDAISTGKKGINDLDILLKNN